MHPLLSKYFQKNKLDAANLSDDEKGTFDRWQKVLTPDPITVESVLTFATETKKILEAELEKWDNSPTKNERLVVAQSILGRIIRYINAPDTERVAMEKFLESLIDSKEEKTL